MADLYPAIEPYTSGMLDTGDGNLVYWEESGNANGKPVVFLHGGPGSGTAPIHRRLFNPERYRIILFDQRGCGKSTPHASQPEADLATNTTWHLIADIEKLRVTLDVDRWQVFGGSWGSTLALAYAQEYPERVSQLIVRGIFTLRRSEIDWFYQEGASHIFPDFWEEYIAPVPEAERGDLVSAYSRLLADPDPAVNGPASRAWTVWENSTIRLHPDEAEIAKVRADSDFALAFARIENHYFSNRGWMDDGQLIANAHRLSGIPGVIVQGRYDICTPAVTAWDLHRAWPEADFHLIPDAGHAVTEPGILSALIEATDRFGEL